MVFMASTPMLCFTSSGRTKCSMLSSLVTVLGASCDGSDVAPDGSDVALIEDRRPLAKLRRVRGFDWHALAQKGIRMSCSHSWLAVFFLVTACGGTVTSEHEPTGGDSPGGAGVGGTGVGGSGAGGSGAGGSGVGGAGTGSAGAPVGGSGGHVAREPTRHRGEATACGVPPPGSGMAGGSAQGAAPPPQECTQNSECTSGRNGRCTDQYCSYDECFADTDCAARAVCICSAPDGTGNRCAAPGCQVDADCPGSWCSPTFGPCGLYGGILSYSCHSAQDECVDDTDCSDGSAGVAYCTYDPQVTHWICSSAQCVG